MFTPYFYFVALAFAAIQASAIVIPQDGNIALLPRQIIIVPTDAPAHVDRRQIIFPTDAPVQVGRRAPEDCKDGQFCGY
ncbi:hypothetical protein QCA50_015199 [Cerrena zonata]|uniref:Uncharacterized protein n=1 Tax=Cerrena zonata TaxID=2478898 RepID=A0AAW0FX05_9APHY